MTTRKRNEFLDIVSSDDEDNDRGYDSEAAEESKGRTVKRRKTQTRSKGVESNSEEEDVRDSEVSEIEAEEDSRLAKRKEGRRKVNVNKDESDEENEGEVPADENGDQFLDVGGDAESTNPKGKGTTKKPLDTAKLKKQTKKNKTGVVYFSTLPPYLKPFALKSLLEARGFSPITKVFLTPAVRAASAPGRRSNKRKTYSDGWVEFASKKTAKICAETLNAKIVGGRKGGWYHDDVLNLRYLRGFKWDDLMSQVQRERSEREAKRRIEDTRARKEEKVFLQGVERGKMIDGIQRKKEEKRRRKMQAEGKDVIDEERQQAVNARRLFKQNEVKVGRDKVSNDQGSLEEDTRRVLGKIF